MSINLAIIYYSMGGSNYQLARWAEEGAKEAGADVRVLKVPELAPESVIVKIPYGSPMLKQQKMFLLPPMRILYGLTQLFLVSLHVLV